MFIRSAVLMGIGLAAGVVADHPDYGYAEDM